LREWQIEDDGDFIMTLLAGVGLCVKHRKVSFGWFGGFCWWASIFS
jgi:hypothetical protein